MKKSHRFTIKFIGLTFILGILAIAAYFILARNSKIPQRALFVYEISSYDHY